VRERNIDRKRDMGGVREKKEGEMGKGCREGWKDRGRDK
jgi:hypothetical protein